MSIINQESINCTEYNITIAGISYVFTKYNDNIFNYIQSQPNKLFFSKNRNQCNKLDTVPVLTPKYLALDSKIFKDVNDNRDLIISSIYEKNFSYDGFNPSDEPVMYSALTFNATELKDKIDNLINYLIFQVDFREFDLIKFDNFVSEIATFRQKIILLTETETETEKNYKKFLQTNKEIFENLYFYIFRPFTYLNNLNNKNYNINFDETSAIFLNDLVGLSAISPEDQYITLCTTPQHVQPHDDGPLNYKFDTIIRAQDFNNVKKFGFNNYDNSCWWDSCMFILFTPNKKYSIFNLLAKNKYFQSKLCEDKELEKILVNALISFYNDVDKTYSYLENRLLINKIGFDLDRIRMGFAEDSLSKFFRDLIYDVIYTSVYFGYEIKLLYEQEYLTVSKDRSNFKKIKWETNNNFHIEFENFRSYDGMLEIDLGYNSIIIYLEKYDLIGLIIWKGYHFTAYAKYLDQDNEENWYYHNDMVFPHGSNQKVTQDNPGNLDSKHLREHNNSVFTLLFKKKNY